MILRTAQLARMLSSGRSQPRRTSPPNTKWPPQGFAAADGAKSRCSRFERSQAGATHGAAPGTPQRSEHADSLTDLRSSVLMLVSSRARDARAYSMAASKRLHRWLAAHRHFERFSASARAAATHHDTLLHDTVRPSAPRTQVTAASACERRRCSSMRRPGLNAQAANVASASSLMAPAARPYFVELA